ncbi:MAG TPA: class I SAM-dependent methyltransferase [Puia sp.]|nr:class I SAM-dependent methyltransferase [Puia sp.]
MSDNTTRFSDRVEDYVKYRPHYPGAILPYLQQTYSFDASWDVADIGSGTGISTELFLGNGNRVFAVEPNAEMRGKAEELEAGRAEAGHAPKSEGRGRPGGEGHQWSGGGPWGVFVSIDGTAEATGLAAGSVRLIVAGQAFHWFDVVKSRAEFTRILRPGGVVVLVWNERLAHTPFEAAYDALIERHGKDYKTTNHRNISEVQIGSFFHPAAFALKEFPNEQWFDFEGLRGRLLSSSYMPKSGPGFAPMIGDLRRLFDTYEQGGRVRVGYDTRVYSGVL